MKHIIPNNIAQLFLNKDPSAPLTFERWLNENDVKELSCDCTFFSKPEVVPLVAEVIAKSQVEIINFSRNRLQQHGPAVVEKLTEPGSNVHTVNLAVNDIAENSPAVASNLTRPGSKVHTVNLNGNMIKKYGSAVAANLIGPNSKIHSVDLSANFMERHTVGVAAILAGPQSNVRNLDLDYNRFSGYEQFVFASLMGPHSKICKFHPSYILPEKVKAVLECRDVNSLLHRQFPKNSLKALAMWEILRSLNGATNEVYFETLKALPVHMWPPILLQARAITTYECECILSIEDILQRRLAFKAPLSPLLERVQSYLGVTPQSPVTFQAPKPNKKRTIEDNNGANKEKQRKVPGRCKRKTL